MKKLSDRKEKNRRLTDFSAKHLALELLHETRNKSELAKGNRKSSGAVVQIETLRILQVLDGFKDRLDKHGKLKLLPEIVREFKKLLEAEVKENIVFVKSTVPLSKEQIGKLKEKVKKVFGKNLEIYVVVDPSLAGGLILKYKDQLVDLSVESKVEDLIKSISEK
ncbi:MAG: ATP synthase F1 subunit delta [Candidatus Dojkabacteria bacterium]|nr:ATP synthase F1 subunit delta [Candidatus Dojkabacteria bacterium]